MSGMNFSCLSLSAVVPHIPEKILLNILGDLGNSVGCGIFIQIALLPLAWIEKLPPLFTKTGLNPTHNLPNEIILLILGTLF